MTRLLRPNSARRGAIAVLSAFLMIGMMGLLAFVIDLGVVLVARDELQRTADAAAIAAAWELIDENAMTSGNMSGLEANAMSKARGYAGLNPVLLNGPQLGNQDIQVGYLSDFSDPHVPLDLSGNAPPNAVRVIARRTHSQNGAIPLIFARALGHTSAIAEAEATAAALTYVRGFQAPAGGGNVDILPFALDVTTWDNMLNGIGTDNWRWDPNQKRVVSGADGILEVNLYPQGTGSPGNRGTVDIGDKNNSTNDIARQILHGISEADFAKIGGTLEFDEEGKLYLNGDTGISAGVKDELEKIKGQPRIIPLFSAVHGPGNNATYTIVKFVGIRIMEVKLTGSNSQKRVIVQPAMAVARGGIPSPTTQTSQFVYSPARLVR